MATTANQPRDDLLRVKPIGVILRETEENGNGLKRSLGVWSLTAMGVGAIVGTGALHGSPCRRAR